jgi:hypothetical protein
MHKLIGCPQPLGTIDGSAARVAGRPPLLAHLAVATMVATAAVWTVLQGLDGVG